jgi:uncharacterized protein YegL
MEEAVKSTNVDHNKKYSPMVFWNSAHHSQDHLQTAESVLHQLAITDREFFLLVSVKTANHTHVLSTINDHVLHVFQLKEKSSEKMVLVRNAKITTELCGRTRSVVQSHAMPDNFSKLMEGVSTAIHTPELQLMERAVFHMSARIQKD